MKEKSIFNWSGGKDSAMCLHKIQQTKQYDIISLLTSVNESFQRISMHGVRVDLLEKQAKSIGLPLLKIQIPEITTMEVYDDIMKSSLLELQKKGVESSIFGDIFLEDLRIYRESKLAEVNLKGIFPLWKIPTDKLIREFIDLGFNTITTCVNDKYLDKSFVGRIIDHDFLKDLPSNVDPCGENGEFHTFVFDGPIFSEPISFIKGEIVYKNCTSGKQTESSTTIDIDNDNSPFNNGFWYCDLI
jgi:uncharacterized protein (TIGR00290 family)